MELSLHGAHNYRRMNMTALAPVRPVLTDELIARCGERAPTYGTYSTELSCRIATSRGSSRPTWAAQSAPVEVPR